MAERNVKRFQPSCLSIVYRESAGWSEDESEEEYEEEYEEEGEEEEGE